MAPTHPTSGATMTRADREAELQKFIKAVEEDEANKVIEPRDCYMENWTGSQLKVQEGDNRSHIWSDHEDPFLDVLENRTGYQIWYKGGDFPKNFKGGVSYVDQAHPIPRKWIFAFDFEAQKVWVDAGPIGPIDWNVVEIKLGESGKDMLHIDPVLKGVANGKMIGNRRQAYVGFYVEN